ncbi:major tail protein [Aerococcus kribbianus]|uniref:Phage tail protein n=1 Tax=Aerococcus kribbianus TaxID=2999064 RepID=A0A9X3JF37_9LACT|nr:MULTISPECIES: major tail protein [unclassified Aerococcus]MCZ0717830.1 phage tail protein [Aerococcus sp. YH-aer221]MCZ0726117.1 phage tail protein [Aerococcus sp. YH-aer222]
MTLVGFKRAIIGVLDESGNITETYEVVGKQDEGATTTAEITGLSKEATRVYGSDVAYYVSQQGTGDVTCNLGLLDLPSKVNDKILGYKQSGGISYVGSDTVAPFCSLIIESKTLQGDEAVLGFFKGKFSKEAINMQTLNNEAYTPEAETYVFSAISDTKDGETFGQVLGKYVGKDSEELSKLRSQLLPGDTDTVITPEA